MKTKQKWTDEQYQLATQIIDTYRHPANPRQTDWQRAYQEHPEWKTQLQSDRGEGEFKAFISRARDRANKTPSSHRVKPPKTPGAQTHGWAPYPEYTEPAFKVHQPFNCAALHALLPREDKKRITNATSAWVAIGWLERVGHGLYKRTAQFGKPAHGVWARLKAKKQERQLANGIAAPTSPATEVHAVEVQAPPPVPLNFCPSCGFNLMMLKAAFSVAAKHSRRQNGA